MTPKISLPPDKKTFHEICDYLGGDLDSPLCQEIKDYMESCPECKIYFDSVKKTVVLCRENEEQFRLSKDAKNQLAKLITSKGTGPS